MSEPEVLYKIQSKDSDSSVRILDDGSIEITGDTSFIGQGDAVIVNHIPAYVRRCAAQGITSK